MRTSPDIVKFESGRVQMESNKSKFRLAKFESRLSLSYELKQSPNVGSFEPKLSNLVPHGVYQMVSDLLEDLK